jgi:hypothetical protein
MIETARPDVQVLRIAPVHKLTEDDRSNVEAAVKQADVVLSQPIGESFGPFSTEALMGLSGTRDWTFFPSIYFGGLFPYLQYLRTNPGTLLGPLGEYHDRRIALSFLQGKDAAACEKTLHEENEEICRAHLRSSIEESRRREENIEIKVMDFIEETMTKSRPCHTFNHPSNLVMWHVIDQFLDKLSMPAVAGSKPPKNPWLDETVAAIPPELSRIAGLDYIEPTYAFQKKPISDGELITGFYEIYRNTPDIESIMASNGVVL